MNVSLADALWTLLVATLSTLTVIFWRWVDGVRERLKEVESTIGACSARCSTLEARHDRIGELVEQVRVLTEGVAGLQKEMAVLHATIDMWRNGGMTPPHGFKVPPNTGS